MVGHNSKTEDKVLDKTGTPVIRRHQIFLRASSENLDCQACLLKEKIGRLALRTLYNLYKVLHF